MRCSTNSLERIALALLLPALASCAATADAPKLAIAAATRGADGLHLALRYQPGAAQLRALDHGVPLVLDVTVSRRVGAPLDYRLGLRYFALSRRYQLAIAGTTDQSFAVRGYLFAALERLRLPLPAGVCEGGERCVVRVAQDLAALPGALRLPALVETAWRVPSADAVVTEPVP